MIHPHLHLRVFLCSVALLVSPLFWVGCVIAQRHTAQAAGNWPGFRGPGATGVPAGRSRTPTTWDVPAGKNVAWNVEIPGLGHASPIVWGDYVYIITAIDKTGESEVKIGVFGDISSLPQEGPHEWRLYCLDKRTGEIIWQHTGYEGAPSSQRHSKSTHADSTPTTDGRYIVTFFGAEGLFCYDMDGNQLWRKDLGKLHCGWMHQRDSQWGYSSSPTIYKDSVIVQCDVQENPFIAAYDLKTGDEIWRTSRGDEVPTWCTPTLIEVGDETHVLINGYKHIGAYNADTGTPVWWFKGGGDIPVPVPFAADGLIYITNGHGPTQPIYAIRPEAKGDINLGGTATSNEHIAWCVRRGGSYIPTPVVLGKNLYVNRINGVMTCFKAKSGEELYKQRVASADKPSGFWSSPVAANGKIYLAAESGDVYVVKAGDTYELLATNPIGEPCLSTPAISDGMIYIRTTHHLVAVGERR